MPHSQPITISPPPDTAPPASGKLDFLTELTRFGPSFHGLISESDAERYCARWARGQYENFIVVSLLLPRQMRRDFFNIYAYCRWSDNLADEVIDSERSLRLLDWWQQQLTLAHRGLPVRQPVMLALQQTFRRHALPLEPFTDLLSAFRQDRSLARYEDHPQLFDYCRRSANPVGRILLHLAKVNDMVAERLSDHVCTGLQLANFCQDVARDAHLGRIYAPRSMWTRHGVTEAMFLTGAVNEQLRSLLLEWVDLARKELWAGRSLVDRVPRWLSSDVDLFVRGGLAILSEIERAGYDVWTRRPTVSKTRQAWLLVNSFVSHFQRSWSTRNERRSPAEISPLPPDTLEAKSNIAVTPDQLAGGKAKANVAQGARS